MATANSSLALPTTLLTTTTSTFPSDITTSSIYPTATITFYFNTTCNTTLSYNKTTLLNTTSLVCTIPSGNSFPYWIFYLWPLDLAVLYVGGVVLYLLGLIIIAMGKSGCCGLFRCIGRMGNGVGNGVGRGVGRGVGSVKKGVSKKAGQTREWNEERLKRSREKRERSLERKRGTIALEAI